MALDKENRDYYYNLGRCVAIVEIMTGKSDLYRLVCINPFAYLPFHLNKALANDRHNLHKELLPVAEIVLMTEGGIPKFITTYAGRAANFALGYFHQVSYLNETYHGIYGKEETTVTDTVPEAISPVADNNIQDLAR